MIKIALNVIWIAGFILLIEFGVGWENLLSLWFTVSPGLLITAVLFVFFSYYLRSLRIYSYLINDIRGEYSMCLKLVLEHNFYNNILPMRSGELSFPLLMLRYFKIPMVRSIPVLLWFRVLDMHTILCFGIYILLQTMDNEIIQHLLFFLWLSFPWLLYKSGFTIRKFVDKRADSKFTKLLQNILYSLPLTTSTFWKSWGWTIANWIIKLMVLSYVLNLFLIAPLSTIVLSVIAGDLTSILPIHGVAGIGTYEAGIVSALMPYGIGIDNAAKGAINLHFFILVNVIVGFCIAKLIHPTCKIIINK